MKTENEENLEKVRKEGVRMRGQGEGGRKEGKEIRKEEGWRMSIFHLILSFSSFFCKTLFFLSFLTSVFHPQLFSTFPLSFLTYLPFFSLCFLYFSVFLSFLTSSFPPVLSTLVLSLPLLPLPLHFLSSFPSSPFLCIHPLFSFLTSSYSPVCFSTFPLFPSFLPSPSFPHASSISVFLSFLTLSSSSPFSYTSSCSVFLFVSFLPLLTSCPLLVFPPHFCLPVLPPSSSSSSPH